MEFLNQCLLQLYTGMTKKDEQLAEEYITTANEHSVALSSMLTRTISASLTERYMRIFFEKKNVNIFTT